MILVSKAASGASCASKASSILGIMASTVKRVIVTMHTFLPQAVGMTRIALACLSIHHMLEGTANVLGLTLETIVTLLTTTKNTSLLLELSHSHGRKLGSLMVLSGVVVDLVNGNGGVNNRRLDSLLVDNGLNGFMDMLRYVRRRYSSSCLEVVVTYVVNMFSAYDGSSTLAVSLVLHNCLVPERLLLSSQVPLRGIVVAVVELAVLNSTQLGLVLLGKHLAVLDRLDSAMVMVLVCLLVDSRNDFFMFVLLHSFLRHCWRDGLMDRGVVMSRLVHEVGNGCLSFVHFDVRF
jgi:hypothetical protein